MSEKINWGAKVLVFQHINKYLGNYSYSKYQPSEKCFCLSKGRGYANEVFSHPLPK